MTRRNQTSILCSVGVALAVTMTSPGAVWGSNTAPHEAKGFQETSYVLSEYESVNLANGNLTFSVPIHVLRTDGGLTYGVTAHLNSKIWYNHSYCSLGSSGYTCLGGVGEVVEAQIANGVSAFGVGWDLRPPRVLLKRPDAAGTTPHPRVVIDTSGAQRKVKLEEPWNQTIDPPEITSVEAGDAYYTVDGSNFRLTVQAVDTEDRPLSVRMEDGSGRVFIFDHIVPLACDGDLDLIQQNQPLDDFNFKVERAGLYLSEIQQGPWTSDGSDGGAPASAISFSYRGQSAATWTSPCGTQGLEQWLPQTITASGEVSRQVVFTYGSDDVLETITVPRFNPVFGSSSVSTADIAWGTDSRQYTQRNATTDFYFSAPHLSEIVFETGDTFTFDDSAPANSRPLTSVVLPTGARVDYDHYGVYPVGAVVTYPPGDGTRDSLLSSVCGATIPPEDDPTGGLESKGTGGLKSRRISYSDASGDRVETTFFMQGLNCVALPGFSAIHSSPDWPYDFTWALTDDVSDRTEYLYTVVVNVAGTNPLDATQAEVHRFHPLTREEFSVDYVEGDGVPYLLPIGGSDPYFEDIDRSDIKVLQHVEIERATPAGVPDIRNFDWGVDRYTYVARQSTYYQPDGSGDVKSCVGRMTPGGPLPDVTCTELRQETTSVTAYLQPWSTRSRSIFHDPSPDPELAHVAFDRATTYTYEGLSDGKDPFVWSLGRRTSRSVSDNGAAAAATGWSWDNRSVGLPDDTPPVQAFFVMTGETSNPSDGGTACTADCVASEYRYNTLGLRDRVTTSGGYGSGFTTTPYVTETAYQHGVAFKTELVDPSADRLLLWQREIDPGSQLARWHVTGDGAGYAYLWDAVGRITDLASIEGDFSQPWKLQSVMEGASTHPLKGQHVEYLTPAVSSTGLYTHEVYDATWATSALGDRLHAGAWGGSPRHGYAFDGRGRLTRETELYPEGARSRFNLTFVDSPGSAEPCAGADSWDHPAKSGVTLASQWRSGSGWPGCPASGSWSGWTEQQTDGLGRVVVTKAADGSLATTAFEGHAAATTSRAVATGLDQNGNAVVDQLWTRQLTDGLGRLRRLVEQRTPYETYVADYDYTVRDQLAAVILYRPGGALAQHRTFSHSPGGYLTGAEHPERTLSYSGYNPQGNATHFSVDGTAMTASFDGYGRATTTASVPTGVLTESVWGDASGLGIGDPGYNQVVRSVGHNHHPGADVSVVHDFTYGQPGGRLVSRHTSVSGFGGVGQGFDLDLSHDVWGNVDQLDLPAYDGCRHSSWSAVGRSYDASWLTGIELVDDGGASEPVAHFSYHPSGRVHQVTYRDDPAFAVWQETADPSGMGRPESIELLLAGIRHDEGSLLGYRYDASGNIWKMGAKRYTYDGLNRLTGYSRYDAGQSAVVPVESFSYDRWGNLTEINRPASPGKSLDPYLVFEMADADADGVPDSNQVATVADAPASKRVQATLEWSRGNLTRHGAVGPLRTKDFEWSDDNRLLKATDDPDGTPTTWRFAYDAGGERVLKWKYGASGQHLEAVLFLRDMDGGLLSEWRYLDSGDTAVFDVTRDVVGGASLRVAELHHGAERDQLKFVALDHLGSTRVVFHQDEVDGSPVVDEVLDLYPFGAVESGPATPSTPQIFTGHERDLGETNTQLDYMHARYYSPNLGRFLSVDPVQGEVGSSQSWNRYGYAVNNPIGLVDPDGAAPLPAVLAIPAAVGALAEAAQVVAFVGSAVGAGLLVEALIPDAQPERIVVEPLPNVNSDGYEPELDQSQVVEGPTVEAPPFDAPFPGTNENPVQDSPVEHSTDRQSRQSGRERASDIPSWAAGERPQADESGKDFADRLMDQKYGKGNWTKGPGSEHNKLKKYGDRTRSTSSTSSRR